MSKIVRTKVQCNNVQRLVTLLVSVRDGTMPYLSVNPLARGGLLEFIWQKYYRNHTAFSYVELVGVPHEVTLYTGAMVTAPVMKLLQKTLDDTFGAGFFSVAVDNGHIGNEGDVHVEQILKIVQAYLTQSYRFEELEDLKAERHKIMAIINMVKSDTTSTRIKNQFSAQQIKRLENVARVIAADIAEIEAFG
jgi:hypothetical protein